MTSQCCPILLGQTMPDVLSIILPPHIFFHPERKFFYHPAKYLLQYPYWTLYDKT